MAKKETKKEFKLSSMMERYLQLKAEYSDCLLFFRLGDFYEMFYDDAKTASEVLDLTLTGRNCGLEERAPMCGVPHHAVDNYVRKLIEAGYRVAICEQLETPSETKEVLKRDVVRVISGGTLMEEEILDEKSANYLLSVAHFSDGYGIAWTDISTGEFNVAEYRGDDYLSRLSDELFAINPSECICNEDFLTKYSSVQYFKNSDAAPKCYHNYAYSQRSAEKKLLSAFNVASLDVFECADKQYAVCAAGGLYEYLEQTQKRALGQIRKINAIKDNAYMVLDGATRRNLELTSRIKDGKKSGSLLWVLDKTRSSMGSRLLKKWVEMPLNNADAINARLNAVEELYSSKAARELLYEAFSGVRDVERVSGRLAYGTATPKDLLSIADTYFTVPEIKKVLKGASSKLLKQINSDIKDESRLAEEIDRAINRDCVQSYKNGGFISGGYCKELDALRDIKNTAAIWLSNLEASEREATGIKNLKVGFNKVFGYYIEVSNSFLDKVPYRYSRKQTLVGGERFITDELKEIEDKILSAESEVNSLEAKLFANLKSMTLEKLAQIQSTGAALAELDAILSLASVSAANGYVKPNIGKKVKKIAIADGRHPVVETLLDKGAYVPNDTVLDVEDNRTMVITGPNMAGKSTYMRQVALIVLMAHVGCFVPARSADISLTDRIFTRIGASDNLSGGQSTFMVEMIEVATILNYATRDSLLILDEIGRGTSTFDGLSIAWAVLEHITKNVRAKTLFATHFHELTELETLDGVKNYRVLVSEKSGKILFLHKIARGGASRSFGIEVASLAGVLPSVVERAKSIMKTLEADAARRDANEMLMSGTDKTLTEQVSLFDIKESKVEQLLRETDVDNLTPLQALTVLNDLKKAVTDNV